MGIAAAWWVHQTKAAGHTEAGRCGASLPRSSIGGKHIAVCSREAILQEQAPFVARPTLRLGWCHSERLWTLIGADGPPRVPILNPEPDPAEDLGWGWIGYGWEQQAEAVPEILAGSLCHSPVRQGGSSLSLGPIEASPKSQHSAET